MTARCVSCLVSVLLCALYRFVHTAPSGAAAACLLQQQRGSPRRPQRAPPSPQQLQWQLHRAEAAQAAVPGLRGAAQALNRQRTVRHTHVQRVKVRRREGGGAVGMGTGTIVGFCTCKCVKQAPDSCSCICFWIGVCKLRSVCMADPWFLQHHLACTNHTQHLA